MPLSPSPPTHNHNAHQQASDANIALYDACATAKDVRQVDTFLAAGASPNWYNYREGGQTALHAAAHAPSSAHSTKIVQRLLEHGAVTSVLTLPEFKLPLHFAASAGNLATVQLLVEHDQKHPNSEAAAATASPFASLSKTPTLASSCVRQGNAYGNTPLHETCITGHELCAAYLLSQDRPHPHHPSLVNLSNKRGSTPLLFSLYGPHPSLALITLLLAHGADPTHVDHDGVGVLHIAAMQGHRKLISYFLKEGKRVGGEAAGWGKDANGHTPMFYAKMSGFDDIVEMLVGAERGKGVGVGKEEEKEGGKEGEGEGEGVAA